MSKAVSISKFIRAIRQLPSDEPRVWPGKWYQTQKQHWLGWLGEYHGPGAYGRKTGIRRDAAYAYNHIVEPEMLRWLMKAAGVQLGLVEAAKRAARRGKTMQEKSAAIRQHVPWESILEALWDVEKKGAKKETSKTRASVPTNMLTMNLHRDFFADILAQPRRKAIEYRKASPFWLRRLERVGPAPFNLRILNGMLPPVPEAIVRVNKVVLNKQTKEIELHLGRVLQTKHWNRKQERPSR